MINAGNRAIVTSKINGAVLYVDSSNSYVDASVPLGSPTLIVVKQDAAVFVKLIQFISVAVMNEWLKSNPDWVILHDFSKSL